MVLILWLRRLGEDEVERGGGGSNPPDAERFLWEGERARLLLLLLRGDAGSDILRGELLDW